jgi:hypothetical protein
MATQALKNISYDEIMQIQAIQAEKRVKDYLSEMKMCVEEGMRKREIEMVKKMLKRNYKPEDIAEISGLSIDQIKELQ